jgi:hypothetical protein
MLCGCSKIIVKPSVKVITIEPSADALSVEEVVKLFSIDAHFALPFLLRSTGGQGSFFELSRGVERIASL